MNDYQKYLARVHHLNFMQTTWRKKAEPFLVGLHTRCICDIIDKAINDFDEGKSTYIIITVPPRSGKALEINTPIPTPNGWKRIIDLQVGDFVYGQDGKPTKVIAKSDVWHNRKLIKVSIDNGRDTIYSDENHLWKVKCDLRQLEFRTYEAKTLTRHSSKNRVIEFQKPIEGEYKKLPIPPYLLGLWLGDGNSRCARITACHEDKEFEINELEKLGYKTHLVPSCPQDYLVEGLHTELNKLGLLKNKHIPMDYLRASYQQRFELLQGLIDTDGYVQGYVQRNGRSKDKCGGEVTFVNTNKRLAEDVAELVRTLGVKCSLRPFRTKLKGKDCGEGYKVAFYLKDCARLERKKERTRNVTRYVNHTALFEETDIIGDTICIEVENKDGMFLCGKSFVPTHNSDIISKYLPAHFIANHPDKDVMVVSYNASLAIGHSKFSRDLLETEEFREIYPKVKLSSKNSASESWGVEGGVGVVTASGLTSGITGKGYHLGILDDYCAGRKEAESVSYRESAWDSFTNDFLTRQAPTCITVILATPWHVDDIIGRIKAKNNPEDSAHYDPSFQKYEIVSFPAQNGTATVLNNKGEEEVVNYDYLFVEHTLSTGEKIEGRFSPEYYESAHASLGDYAYQALYQCDPKIRGGNLIKVDKVHLHNSLDDFPITKYYRIWDLAHTEKQTQKDDPDWTSGTLLAFVKRTYDSSVQFDQNGERIHAGTYWELWIKDVARIRANAPERDNFIRAVAEKDGQAVTIAVENSIESKDALNQMMYIFQGRRVVRPIQCKGDKVSRMSYVEPIFDGGNVHVYNGAFTLDWLNEVKEFPSGKHDDQVDNMSAGYELCCNQIGKVFMGGVSGI